MSPPHRSDSRKEPSLAIQSTLLTGARVAGYLFAFFIPIVLVRIFSQTQFGLYKQALLVAETAQPILNLGLNASLFYFLPRNRRQGHHFLLQALVLLWALGFVGGLAILAGADPIARFMTGPEGAPQLAALLPFAAAYLMFGLPGDALLYLPIIDRRPVLAAAVAMGNEALKFGVAAACASTFRTVSSVLMGLAALAALRALVLMVYVRYRGREEGGRVNRADLKRQLAYALPYAVAVLFEIALQKAHHYFVSAQATPAEFAIYAAGVVQIPLAALLSTSVAEVLLVRASTIYQSGDLAELHRLWLRSLARLCVFIVPIWVGSEVFARDIISLLFQESYVAATPVFRIFLIRSLLTVVIDHGILRAVGDTRFLLVTNVLGLLVSLGIMALTPPDQILMGAVTAYVVGFALTRFLGLARVAHRLEVPFWSAFPWRPLALSLVLATGTSLALYLPLRGLESPALRLAIGVPVVAVLYGVLVTTTRLVPKEETLELLRKLRLVRRS
ncbi:MAG: lipopolysaccharide biosynthesis protein [Gemmatimonadota bacterium]|nr:lipopolysaccharide biosynthesis protein [Gemmatimonadota bacterium]